MTIPLFKEPLVRIVYPSESELEWTHRAPERLELSCEISQADAQVRWYRDGLEVEESPLLVLEVQGAHRKLVIPRTSVDHSGEYVCDTEDDSVTFLVTVTGTYSTLYCKYFIYKLFPVLILLVKCTQYTIYFYIDRLHTIQSITLNLIKTFTGKLIKIHDS